MVVEFKAVDLGSLAGTIFLLFAFFVIQSLRGLSLVCILLEGHPILWKMLT